MGGVGDGLAAQSILPRFAVGQIKTDAVILGPGRDRLGKQRPGLVDRRRPH